MKTIINHNSSEVSDSVKVDLNAALALVKGKRCIKSSNDHRPVRIAGFVAELGCNKYTTSITLRNDENGVEAYFCNGLFWTSITKREVEFI